MSFTALLMSRSVASVVALISVSTFVTGAAHAGSTLISELRETGRPTGLYLLTKSREATLCHTVLKSLNESYKPTEDWLDNNFIGDALLGSRLQAMWERTWWNHVVVL